MHETALMRTVMDIALDKAQANQAKRIGAINLRIGALRGVVPEALDFAFEALKEGTIAASAKLNVEYAPLTCYCHGCGNEFQPKDYSSVCPKCLKKDIEIWNGLEMTVISIEVD